MTIIDLVYSILSFFPENGSRSSRLLGLRLFGQFHIVVEESLVPHQTLHHGVVDVEKVATFLHIGFCHVQRDQFSRVRESFVAGRLR